MTPARFGEALDAKPDDELPPDPIETEFGDGLSSEEGKLLQAFCQFVEQNHRGMVVSHLIEPFLRTQGQSQAFAGEIG